ncbi:dermatopontin [Aplysia californica]|uniref:Dermatopontin n=1 Tax=Aplysia californica TaxID=6500 RepID=A0ABM0KAR5_APLCA|nr:dermatopontin [Aplysia californica]
MLRLAFLAVCIFGLAKAYYQNDWDRPHHFQCPKGQYVTSVHSIHDNGKEDRRWELKCGGEWVTENCVWSTHANSWDSQLYFLCPNNMVVTGMDSYHNNHKEDRLFKFRCCGIGGIGKFPRNCRMTDWVNYWDGPMNFQLSKGKVITGAYSVHDNHKEDRRWRFQVCEI